MIYIYIYSIIYIYLYIYLSFIRVRVGTDYVGPWARVGGGGHDARVVVVVVRGCVAHAWRTALVGLILYSRA